MERRFPIKDSATLCGALKSSRGMTKNIQPGRNPADGQTTVRQLSSAAELWARGKGPKNSNFFGPFTLSNKYFAWNIKLFFKKLQPIYFQTVSGPFTVQKRCFHNVKALLLDTKIRLFRLYKPSDCKQRLTEMFVQYHKFNIRYIFIF